MTHALKIFQTLSKIETPLVLKKRIWNADHFIRFAALDLRITKNEKKTKWFGITLNWTLHKSIGYGYMRLKWKKINNRFCGSRNYAADLFFHAEWSAFSIRFFSTITDEKNIVIRFSFLVFSFHFSIFNNPILSCSFSAWQISKVFQWQKRSLNYRSV